MGRRDLVDEHEGSTRAHSRRFLPAALVAAVAAALGCPADDGAARIDAAAPVDAAAMAGASAAPSTAFDLQGNPVDPLAVADAEIVVLTFVTPDCPLSNRYAPELARIAASVPADRVAWWLVYPDPDVDAAQIEAHRREFALPGTPLRDPGHVLVARAFAVVTPEVAVFRRGGGTATLMYRGRIDDRVPEFGRARPEPTRRELVDGLDAVLAGRAVAVSSAKAVGCPIGDLR